MKKRLLSILLVVTMLLPVGVLGITISASAADENEVTRYTVLVLDTSGGVDFQSGYGSIFYTADTAINYVKQAANKFVSDVINAGGTNYVSLVTYDSTARTVSGFSENITATQTKINQLTAASKNSTNIAAGLQQADTLLDGISDENAIKNVVLFTTGFTMAGSYNYTGHYSESTIASGWQNSGNGVKLYAYANVAYDAAESVKSKANLYSIGLFQNLNDIPAEGHDVLAFFKLTALDLATSSDYFYDVDDPSKLEFVFGEIAEDIVKKDGTFIYAAGMEAKNYESNYYYDDNYFLNSSYEYNHQLATMSLCMALAAYGRAGVDYENQGKNDETDYADYNIRKLMGDIGFEDVDTSLVGTADHYNAGYPDKPIEDSIGVAIGNREITLKDGSKCTVIAVAVRGGGYEREWGGNFRIGSGMNHEGFETARNSVIIALRTYIEKYGDKLKGNDIKLWFSGYSRGAAVANLSAAFVNNNISSYPWIGTRSNVYAYCFETPAGTTDDKWNSDAHKNIFSWVNPNDFVTKVAMVEWGFHRYGITKFFPIRTSEKTKADYLSKENAMLDKFEKLNQFERNNYAINKFEGIDAVDYLVAQKNGELYSLWEGDISKFNFVLIEQYPELFTDGGIPIPDGIPIIGGGHLIAIKYKTTDTPMNEFLDDLIKDIAKNAFEDRGKYVSNWQDLMVETIADSLGSGKKYDEDEGKVLLEAFKPLLTWAAVWKRDSIATLALNHESIIQGHFPEVALAWMQSLDANYYQASGSTGKYRVIHINCPVDVTVYDSAGAKIGEIINNIPVDLGDNSVLTLVDKDGQKKAYLATDEEYTVKLKAVADGHMTYSVSEYDQNECGYTRKVSYNNLEIKKDDVFESKVENLEQIPDAVYSLSNSEGQILNPSEDLAGEDIADYTVNLQATVGGKTMGEGTRMHGEFAQVIAIANEGYRFVGWYRSNNKISTEETYRFAVTEDVSLEARFESTEEETPPSAIDAFLAMLKQIIELMVKIVCQAQGIDCGNYVDTVPAMVGDIMKALSVFVEMTNFVTSLA